MDSQSYNAIVYHSWRYFCTLMRKREREISQRHPEKVLRPQGSLDYTLRIITLNHWELGLFEYKSRRLSFCTWRMRPDELIMIKKCWGRMEKMVLGTRETNLPFLSGSCQHLKQPHGRDTRTSIVHWGWEKWSGLLEITQWVNGFRSRKTDQTE